MDKKNINNLLNGHSFVVPEIQREYVWGAAKNKRILVQFLKDLDTKLSTGPANIGFLYSYKSGSENYLIDGQQRYTTMLLLLHYLSVIEGDGTNSSFIKKLRLDCSIQAFSYRVRSYTESFLQNLFSSKSTDSKDINDQLWYKDEYKQDPTIKAMVGALDVFTEQLPECRNLTYNNILSNVYFWYFDVDQTSQGEELYITMNSRGERLTDSEQIKPRLLRDTLDKKEYYGKKWDDWEEFFYSKGLRGSRTIEVIDTAMNNIIRIVLELKDLHEHSHIKPVEDAALITLADIEQYMDALQQLVNINDSKYKDEVVRLYGDTSTDGNFYVLKSLLTTCLRNPEDSHEFECVYQTISNHVRRNKLKNLAFLGFLDSYKNSPAECSFYSVAKTYSSVFTGHELEKIVLCMEYGTEAEDALWEEQSKAFWNGEIKQLLTWSKKEGSFSLSDFNRIRKTFHNIFNKKANEGWTSDSIRQAMITQRMPKYPLVENYYTYFGYTDVEWKKIIANQPNQFLDFLEMFDGADEQQIILITSEMKASYPETPENIWAEFVQHDYLLAYCNTKHIQHYRKEYGLECVKNSYKLPYSVKTMHLDNYLRKHLREIANGDCEYWIDQSGWHTTIVITSPDKTYRLHVQYRQDKSQSYEVGLKILTNNEDLTNSIIAKFIEFGFDIQEYETYKNQVQTIVEFVPLLNKWMS